jgi:hypothetical protein
MARKETRVVQAGREPSLHAGAVNTPVYRMSTVLFPDAETMRTGGQPYTYGRRGTPTTRALEHALCALESGARTVLTPSGLSACNLAILTACGAGDHILVTDSVYGPTRVFCQRLGKRYGITTTYFEPCLGAAIPEQFRPETKAVFLESPGSFTFEVQDVPAIAAAAHERGIAVILDNTWATPFHFNAMTHGVDLSVQAITKYIAGHSDVLMGSVTANAAFKDRLVETHGTLGLCASGRRGLSRRTRLAHASRAAQASSGERHRNRRLAEDARGSRARTLSAPARRSRPRAVEARFSRALAGCSASCSIRYRTRPSTPWSTGSSTSGSASPGAGSRASWCRAISRAASRRVWKARSSASISAWKMSTTSKADLASGFERLRQAS